MSNSRGYLVTFSTILWASRSEMGLASAGARASTARNAEKDNGPQRLDRFVSSGTISPEKRDNTVRKRRALKPELRACIVLEKLAGIRPAGQIRREHQLSPQVLAHWKAELVDRAPEIFAAQRHRGDEQQRLACGTEPGSVTDLAGAIARAGTRRTRDSPFRPRRTIHGDSLPANAPVCRCADHHGRRRRGLTEWPC